MGVPVVLKPQAVRVELVQRLARRKVDAGLFEQSVVVEDGDGMHVEWDAEDDAVLAPRGKSIRKDAARPAVLGDEIIERQQPDLIHRRSKESADGTDLDVDRVRQVRPTGAAHEQAGKSRIHRAVLDEFDVDRLAGLAREARCKRFGVGSQRQHRVLPMLFGKRPMLVVGTRVIAPREPRRDARHDGEDRHDEDGFAEVKRHAPGMIADQPVRQAFLPVAPKDCHSMNIASP